MSTLVICKSEHGQVNSNDIKAITAAQHYQQPITCLVYSADTELPTLATYKDLQQIICVANITAPIEIAKAILHCCEQTTFQQIIACNNTFTKQALPILAALKDTEMFSDVIAIIDETTIKRPLYAGDFIATIKANTPYLIMSIRASAFAEPAVTTAAPTSCSPISVEADTAVQFTKANRKQQTRDLTTADIIITGGRGLGDGEHFALIQQLADKLNAAVGATRAAVDAGWVDNALQVGQTGKIVAPKLYIAVGVSGAIQHLAGIKDAECIIAINTDAKAPIMQFADYALVGDLFEIVPKLIELL